MSRDPFDPFAAVMQGFDPAGRFSPEAVESLRAFIVEGDFRVRGERVLPDPFPWLDPVYNLTRTEILARRWPDGIELFKASQLGATVWAMLFILWLSVGKKGLNVGYYFPAKPDLEDLVKTRFDPLLASSERMRGYVREGATDNTRVKQIGHSTVYFRYMGGVAGKDSIDLDVLVFDEVRLMETAEVEQTRLRTRQSDIALTVYVSTAGNPGDLMDRSYRRSCQLEWHSRCPSCDGRCRDELSPADGLVLADMDIPDFVRERPDGTVEYYCKHTGEVLAPLNGGYAAHNPGNDRRLGVRFAAPLAPKVPAEDLLDLYRNSTNRAEFWKATMARPYVDPTGRLLTRDGVNAALARGEGLTWPRLEADVLYDVPQGEPVYVGVDCRTEELHLIALTPSRLVWAEVLQGEGTYERMEERLAQLGPVRSIIDMRPHTTTTRPLARRLRHLHLADYRRSAAMVRLKKDEADYRLDDEVHDRKTVLIDRTLSLKFTGSLVAERLAMPAATLWQRGVRDRDRHLHAEFDLSAELAEHLVNLALKRTEKTTESDGGGKTGVAGEFTEDVVNIAFDPHFFHALNYAVMAMMLDGGSGVSVMPAPDRTAASPRGPFGVKRRAPERRVCGACKHYDAERAFCPQLGLSGIGANDPKCDVPGLYQARRES